MFPSVLGRKLALLILLVLVSFWSRHAVAQGVLIPVAARQDMVFDHAGKYLYITTSDGWVRRYNLASSMLDAGYYIGGSLNGLDIDAADSFLLIGAGTQESQYGIFHKLDLATGTFTTLTYPHEGREIGGGWDVAIASNGIALAIGGWPASGYSSVLRQIDLASGTISIRHDVPPAPPFGQTGGLPLRRSADGKHIVIQDIYSGPFTYDAQSNTFSARGLFPSAGAISRDGTLLATARQFTVALNRLQDSRYIHSFTNLGGPFAFSPVSDTLFSTRFFSNEIFAYDTNTFAELFRLSVGEFIGLDSHPFQDVLAVSGDGQYLALTTSSGIRLFRLPQSPPEVRPVFRGATDMVFDHAGRYLYIGTEGGFIWPYHLATGQLETPINAGGRITGMDIAADDSFLIAGQFYNGLNESTFHKLDLQTRALSNLNYVPLFASTNEQGPWDVAITAKGKALATTHLGSGFSWVPVREIDLATGSVSFVPAAPGSNQPMILGAAANQGSQIHRSADRTRLLFLEIGISSGPRFTYDAGTNTFSPVRQDYLYWDDVSAAVNRNGTLMAWGGGINIGAFLETLPGFIQIQSFPSSKGAVAFDAVSDTLYCVDPFTRQIIAYDTGSFSEKFRVDIGEGVPVHPIEQFGPGNLVASQDGRYLALVTPSTVRVFDLQTKTVTPLPTPTPPAPPALGQLANISTRATVHAGDGAAIAGFIVTGTESKTLVLRGIGPELAHSGVTGAMEDPTLELYDSAGVLLASNDNWKDSQQAALVYSGLAPAADDRQAAILATLSPGAYTAVLRGKNATTGVALVELYDIDANSTSKLANISTRGFVGQNNDVMIAGMIITSSNARVGVRGMGPSLKKLNISDALEDPVVDVHNSDGAVVASNNDWEETQLDTIWNASLSPADSREAALMAVLSPGNYTTVLRGQNSSTGVGLIEVYRMP